MNHFYRFLKKSLFLISFFLSHSLFAQPVINSFSPTSGSVGASVTITGTGFNTVADSNIVYFGAVRAVVTSAASTSLTVTVPLGATYQPVTVTNNRLTGYSQLPFNVTFAGGGYAFNVPSFSSKTNFFGGYNPRSISIVDLNGDGKPDVFETNQGDSTAGILVNNGSPGTISFYNGMVVLGSNPFGVATGDFNGDGKPDVVVANFNSGNASSVSILKNTSTGNAITFARRIDLPTGNGSTTVSVADMNVDGKPDVIVSTGNSGIISVFLNNSSGDSVAFAPKVDFINLNHAEIAVGDLDADGKPDVVLANFSGGSMSILRNTSTAGNLSLAAPISYTAGTNPTGAAIGDFNGDGKPDIAVANYGSSTVSVFKNLSTTGNISFADKIDYVTGTNPRSIVAGDLNGDNKPELVVTTYVPSAASVFRNISSGDTLAFDNRVDYVVGSNPTSAAIGDFDGDGYADLTVANDNLLISVFKNAGNKPYVTSFTPAAADSGTVVVIRGNKFTGATAVSFGGVPASSFVINSDTVILATVGTGASGDVTVFTPDGNASKAGFTFIAPPIPVITSFTPTSGGPGENVIIQGSHFTGATAVRFGGTLADTFLIMSDTSILALVANGASGDVTVTTSFGTASKAGFTFIPIDSTTLPVINYFAPDSAKTGDHVWIYGTHFTGATFVGFGLTMADSFVVVNDSTIDAVVGQGSSGYVMVTTPYGTAEKPGFTFINTDSLKPVITRFNPTSQQVGFGVVIFGARFTGATQVSFGGTSALSFTVLSDTAIGAVVGIGSSGNVSVTNHYGTATKSGFTYIPSDTAPPVIRYFTPTSASAAARVTIYGSHFNRVRNVSFGNVNAISFSVVADSMIFATVGAGASGDVTVTTLFGTAVKPGFTYIPGDTTPPSISYFTPTAAGRTATVNIYGSHFTTTTSVRFGGVHAMSFTVSSDSLIYARVNSGASGDVTVTTPFGTATKPGFTYINLDTVPPVIRSFTPTSGSSGTTVTIYGANFIGTLAVRLGNIISAFAVANDSTIFVLVGSGASGNVSVIKRYDSATLGGFTYIAPPVITLVTPASAPVGTTVTIWGRNFKPVADSNVVYFGAVRAVVTSASDSVLTAIVPGGATYMPVTVTTNNLMGYSAYPFNVLFPGTGFNAGSFASKVDFATGAYPRHVSMGDIDGDGKSDMLVVNNNDSTISVYRNTGSAGVVSFAPRINYPARSDPFNATIADLNGDGKPEVIVSCYGNNRVLIYRNNSTVGSVVLASQFSLTLNQYSNPISVSVRDLNGDGKPEIVTVNNNGNNVSVFKNNSTSLGISFGVRYDFAVGNWPHLGTISDLNNDGKPEIIAPNYNDNTISVLKNTSTATTISFAAKVNYATGTNPFHVIAGDLNADGKPEVLVANSNSASVSVFENISNDTAIILAPKVDYATGSSPVYVSIANLDGDGKPDVAVANFGSGTVSVYKNTSNGTIALASKVDYATGSLPRTVVAGDLDGDGKPEMATVNSGSNTLSIFRNLLSDSALIMSRLFTTANSDAANDLFTVYPNPASQFTLVKHPVTNNNAHVQLVDVTGRLVRTIIPGKNAVQTKVDVQGLTPGVYKLLWSDGVRTLTRSLLVK